MATGDLIVKPSPMRFIGRFFKNYLLSEKPLAKNGPTAPEFIVSDAKEFGREKENFLKAFEKLAKGGKSVIKTEKHPFFGTMKSDEWARLTYKHLDHHFNQFGV